VPWDQSPTLPGRDRDDVDDVVEEPSEETAETAKVVEVKLTNVHKKRTVEWTSVVGGIMDNMIEVSSFMGEVNVVWNKLNKDEMLNEAIMEKLEPEDMEFQMKEERLARQKKARDAWREARNNNNMKLMLSLTRWWLTWRVVSWGQRKTWLVLSDLNVKIARLIGLVENLFLFQRMNLWL
jgi:hypothetical protein